MDIQLKNTGEILSTVYDQERIMSELTKDLYTSVDRVLRKVKTDIENVYSQMIDMYYSYKTHQYIRYGQSKTRTGTGIRLYKGIKVSPVKESGYMVGIDNKMDADLLPSYDTFQYSDRGTICTDTSYVDAEMILDFFYHGHRPSVGVWELGQVYSEFFDLSYCVFPHQVEREISTMFSDILIPIITEDFMNTTNLSIT